MNNPIFDCSYVSDSNATFTADPFLFYPHGFLREWYLFFEVKPLYGNGKIGVAVSLDQGHRWQYLGIALSEKFHLSYPYVFRDEKSGDTFMLPQTVDTNLRLYKAVRGAFPMKWEFFSTIAEKPLADANIFYWNESWWIIALYEPDYRINPDLYPGQRGFMRFLHVLYADSPLGPWTQHPHNCEMTRTQGSLRYGVDMRCQHGREGIDPLQNRNTIQYVNSVMKPHKVGTVLRDVVKLLVR